MLKNIPWAKCARRKPPLALENVFAWNHFFFHFTSQIAFKSRLSYFALEVFHFVSFSWLMILMRFSIHKIELMVFFIFKFLWRECACARWMQFHWTMYAMTISQIEIISSLSNGFILFSSYDHCSKVMILLNFQRKQYAFAFYHWLFLS